MKLTVMRVTLTIILGPTFLCLASAIRAQQMAPPPSARLGQRSSQAPRLLGERIQSSTLPATASPEIIWVPCAPEAQSLGAACGKLPVPLDRRHPAGAKIEIYFELYLHTNPGPEESAILVNPGGPGLGTTAFRALILSIFGAEPRCA
jgi:hypothetical protein